MTRGRGGGRRGEGSDSRGHWRSEVGLLHVGVQHQLWRHQGSGSPLDPACVQKVVTKSFHHTHTALQAPSAACGRHSSPQSRPGGTSPTLHRPQGPCPEYPTLYVSSLGTLALNPGEGLSHPHCPAPTPSVLSRCQLLGPQDPG